jgi:branched-chain amino acid transport system ATP-binding protein
MSREVLLKATALTKRFGGLTAVNGIALEWARNEIHAVIGPNGAGKSTLTHLLSGDLVPTSGRVELLGQDITGHSPESISKAGLGRSFQKTNVFLPLTVWENVRLSAQARRTPSPANPLAWLRQAQADRTTQDLALHALAMTQLADRRAVQAQHLSHGEQRQLEIAMCLATEPQVLLLDEPLAGMGTAEAERMIDLLGRLKADHAVLLVEHDMDAVFALADVLSVMVNGQLIASGTVDDIRAHPEVQAAYLGEVGA